VFEENPLIDKVIVYPGGIKQSLFKKQFDLVISLDDNRKLSRLAESIKKKNNRKFL